MGQVTTEALVLRGVDFSETSRIITLLTPGHGKVACMAKGVRRANSPLAAVLDTFNRVEVVLFCKDGRDIQTLAEASLLDRFPAIRADIERSAWAAFPIEVAGKVAHENEPSEALFSGLRRGLEDWASTKCTARTYACWLVARVLQAAGFGPELDVCSHCGATATLGFAFDGGVVCGACRADRRLTSAGLAALRALFSAELTCPSLTADKEVFQVLRAYASRQVDADFRSARVLQEMFGHET